MVETIRNKNIQDLQSLPNPKDKNSLGDMSKNSWNEKAFKPKYQQYLFISKQKSPKKTIQGALLCVDIRAWQ